MATQKQKLAIDKLVENRGNVSKSMVEAGYDPTTAKNPKNLTDSKGFKELCDELGLTDNLIVTALVEDIAANKGKRVPELALAAKIKGLEKAPEISKDNPIHILLAAYGLGEGEGNATKTDESVQSSSTSEA